MNRVNRGEPGEPALLEGSYNLGVFGTEVWGGTEPGEPGEPAVWRGSYDLGVFWTEPGEPGEPALWKGSYTVEAMLCLLLYSVLIR